MIDAATAWLVSGVRGQVFGYTARPEMVIYCPAVGLITPAPLLLYLSAAAHLPPDTVAVAQYSPSGLQFLPAAYYFHEPFDLNRLIGFLLVWTGLGIYSLRLIYHYRRNSA